MNCMNCGAVVQNTDVCQSVGLIWVFRESPFSYLSCITIRGWKKRKSGLIRGNRPVETQPEI